jgi:hypothetical protein
VSRGKPAALGGLLLAMTWLAACGVATGPASTTAAGPSATPRLVTAKPVGGSPGRGPLIISSPAPLRGGKASSQKVVLSDRTLVIAGVTRQLGTNQSSIVITLNLVLRNTGDKIIQNQPAFFQLVGPEGDTFAPQGSNSGGFYQAIDAHSSRSGTIGFKIPAGAVSNLYLLYRAGTGTGTVLTRLRVG